MSYDANKYGDGKERLNTYMVLAGYDVCQAAAELDVPPDDVRCWLSGIARPNSAQRVAIEHWSAGNVPAPCWGPVRHGSGEYGQQPLPRRLLPPARRSECIDGPRPCPRIACRYHLWNDFKVNVDPDELPRETCALDLAEEGVRTLTEIGALLGLTRERVRQIEDVALRKLGARPRIKKMK